MKLPLGARYSLAIVSLVLTVVASMAIVLLFQFRNSADEITALSTQVLDDELYAQVERRGQGLADLLAESLVTPLYRYDMQTIHGLLNGVLEQDDVVYAYVLDEAGRLVHDGTLEIADYGKPASGLIAALASPDDTSVRIAHVASPVAIAGTTIGGVRVGLSLNGVNQQIAGMRVALSEVIASGTERHLVSAVLVMVVFLVAGIVLAVLVSRSLVRPIRQLADLATRVGTGDYDHEVAVGRNDELGDLATSFRDMSRNLAARTAEASHLAYHDSLTDLPNRAQLRGFLESAMVRARLHGTLTALLFIDLDDFKHVNDSFGHDGGDRLLVRLSERLRHCLRTADKVVRGDEEASAGDAEDKPARHGGELIARLGGDEFTVVLENVHAPANAAAVARRILAALEKPFTLDGREATIGASIGITLYPHEGETVNDLLREADQAMYQAKQRGKNQYRFYRPLVRTPDDADRGKRAAG